MRSLVLRVNPLVLLAFGFLALAGSFAVRELPIAIATCAAYGLAAVIFLPSWRYPAACLALTLVSSALIFYSTLRLGNTVDRATTAALRIVVLAWPGSVLIGFIDLSRLADYLTQRLHVPARGVAAFAAVMQRITALGQTGQQLERARRVRGLGPGRNLLRWVAYAGQMTFALLVSAMRGATQMSIAMDARGFADAHERTCAEPTPWTRLDSFALAFAVTLGAFPVVLLFG